MRDERSLVVQDPSELLRSVAEQLKLPLTTIAREAELAHLSGDSGLADLRTVRLHAESALRLVDSYLLGLQLMQRQTALDLEPVSISSMLVDVAHQLHDFAKQYGVTTQLHIAGKYEPVMAHRDALRAAMLSVGYALLEGYPGESRQLTLAVHRTPHGIVTGLYGDYEKLSAVAWRKALALQASGRTLRPLQSICAGSGAGLFVADTILQAMATRLRVGKYRHQQGIASTFQPSQQLFFV